MEWLIIGGMVGITVGYVLLLLDAAYFGIMDKAVDWLLEKEDARKRDSH